MRVRLNLQWRVLVLMIGGMAIILLVSSYFYDLATKQLVDEERYNTALSRTAALGTHILSEQLLTNRKDLHDDLNLLKTARPDFKQIDVYSAPDARPQLVSSTDADAQRLPVLDEHSRDNELGEMERPAPGIVTMEVIRDGVRYWIMTVTLRTAEGPAYVSALVLKNADPLFLQGLAVRRDLTLGAAIFVSSGLCYIVFVYLFRRPARDIVTAMKAATHGDFGARAVVRRNDELGDIARGFNTLMDELHARDEERERLVARISGFNEQLRTEVDTATRELRDVNDALFHTRQRLGQMERLAAVGQVAASLAHEIGTPLNSIGGHVQLLRRRFPDDAEAQRRISIISSALESIVATVRSLLWQAGRRRPEIQQVDLGSVVSETLRLVGPTLAMHQIRITVDMSAAEPVLADAERLQHVLLNLINNAVEAMPTGGKLSLQARAADAGQTMELAVRDDGPGPPAEIIDHLFEITWTTKPTGSGFGLATSRELMQAQGGGLEFIPGSGGACFVMRMPVAARAGQQEERHVAAN